MEVEIMYNLKATQNNTQSTTQQHKAHALLIRSLLNRAFATSVALGKLIASAINNMHQRTESSIFAF